MLPRMVWALWGLLALTLVLGCDDAGETSRRFAKAHVHALVDTSKQDVEEMRRGLPEGAKHLASVYEGDTPPADDRKAVRTALEEARAKVQDLRVAKATFFALVDRDGRVLRNDQEQDLMADRNAFEHFPALEKALQGKYVETLGSMKEARGVAEPRPDAQWVAGAPVQAQGKVRGVYVGGWALSSYARRLEFKLRGEIRSELMAEDDARKNEALVYVYVLAGGQVIGAPMSPEVNMEKLKELGGAKLAAGTTHDQVLEITGRTFGLAVEAAPALGDGVALAVLRSET